MKKIRTQTISIPIVAMFIASTAFAHFLIYDIQVLKNITPILSLIIIIGSIHFLYTLKKLYPSWRWIEYVVALAVLILVLFASGGLTVLTSMY